MYCNSVHLRIFTNLSLCHSTSFHFLISDKHFQISNQFQAIFPCMSCTVCITIPKSFLHVISQNYFHIPVFLSQLQTTANVTVNGRQVPVTNMSITDATGQIDIALWRDVASAPVAINSTYSFTHLTSSMYNNRRRLCSTRHTTVTVSLISLNTFSVQCM